MSWTLDARIPVMLVGDEAALLAALAAPGGRPAAVLAENAGLAVSVPMPHGAAVTLAPAPPSGALAMAVFDPATAPHAAACACCAGRLPAAAALDLLFQARVRGQVGWFERVVALAEGAAARAEVEAAMRDDRLTAARFRTG